MTDVDPTTSENPPAGDGPDLSDVTADDMIRRGKGLALTAIDDASDAGKAVQAFRELQGRFTAAEQELEGLKSERNAAIYALKSEHNVSFSAIAELIDGTSSLAMYLYERAQGKTAKQIREESQRSRAAKEKFLESDPDRASARKQTPEEKAFRKQQREALKAFLEAQKAAGVDVGDADPDAPTDDD